MASDPHLEHALYHVLDEMLKLAEARFVDARPTGMLLASVDEAKRSDPVVARETFYACAFLLMWLKCRPVVKDKYLELEPGEPWALRLEALVHAIDPLAKCFAIRDGRMDFHAGIDEDMQRRVEVYVHARYHTEVVE